MLAQKTGNPLKTSPQNGRERNRDRGAEASAPPKTSSPQNGRERGARESHHESECESLCVCGSLGMRWRREEKWKNKEE
eukprot:8383262-Pyramimonas_sp.AAC.1